MPDVEDIVDKFSGMITREQAAMLLEDAKIQETDDRKINDVKSILELINVKKEMLGREPYSINVQDYIYRIFNPAIYSQHGKQSIKRSLALGSEGSTIKLNLRDQLSEFIDINALEREDLVLLS